MVGQGYGKPFSPLDGFAAHLEFVDGFSGEGTPQVDTFTFCPGKKGNGEALGFLKEGEGEALRRNGNAIDGWLKGDWTIPGGGHEVNAFLVGNAHNAY